MTADATVPTAAHRSGFACFVGRPNVGKSTLTNALVGEKVAITSSKPQTTRHAIRGILNRPDAQLVLVDTPGLHKPQTLLGERLNAVVRETWSDVDVVGFCVPADEPIGAGDRFLARELAQLGGTPIVAVLTKTDRVSRKTIAERLLALQALGVEAGREWADLVPVSANKGEQMDVLLDVLTTHLPDGPQMYVDGELTDEPERVMVAELIREAALEGVRQEMPHSLAVVVEELHERKGRPANKPLIDIAAIVYLERPSQKPILLGPGGSRLKDIGTRARAAIEEMLGSPVYLDLHIKIAKDWQRDPKQLNKLGF